MIGKSARGPKKGPPPGGDARQRCYAALVAEMQAGIAWYYGVHKDRLGDARSDDAVAWSELGLQRLLKVLDDYDIRDFPDHAQVPQETKKDDATP